MKRRRHRFDGDLERGASCHRGAVADDADDAAWGLRVRPEVRGERGGGRRVEARQPLVEHSRGARAAFLRGLEH